MPTTEFRRLGFRGTGGEGTAGVVIQVGGQRALIRSLRALERQRGDARAARMRREIQNADKDSANLIVKALKEPGVAPVGNYRKKRRGQRFAKRDNSRAVSRGKFKGRQQPAGELRKSIKSRSRAGRRDVVLGGESAFYARAVIAGHKLPGRRGGEADPDPFLWDTIRRVRPQAQARYRQVLERVAASFVAEHGAVAFQGYNARTRRRR